MKSGEMQGVTDCWRREGPPWSMQLVHKVMTEAQAASPLPVIGSLGCKTVLSHEPANIQQSAARSSALGIQEA